MDAPNLDVEKIAALWEDAFLTSPELKAIRIRLQEEYPERIAVKIPLDDIIKAQPKLTNDLYQFAEAVLKIGERVLWDMLPPDVRMRLTGDIPPRIRPIKLKDNRQMNLKSIRSSHYGQLFAFTGRVRKSLAIMSKVHIAAWKCARCGTIQMIPINGLNLEEPLACDAEAGGCGSPKYRTRFIKVDERSLHRNLQIIYLDEKASVSEGQPQTKMVFLWDDLVGVYPCNDITINGIVKFMSLKKDRNAVLDTYIEAVSVEIDNARDPVNISAQDEEAILKIARGPDPMARLRRNIAPSIYGMDDIKDAIILQQAGGTPKRLPDGIKKRGNIHILIVGDPGIAKSSILSSVPSISPTGYYGSGEGTSGAGLTFTMDHDEFDGTWYVEMGLFPMCDKGVCCFDELDKIKEEDLQRLHTALESGELPVSKAGIVTTLAADASLLASANPKFGRFDQFKPLMEQLNLSQPLISRFDLIFSLSDVPNEEHDQKVANRILTAHMDELADITPDLSSEFLRKYFYYVKNKTSPILTKEMRDVLNRTYVNLRMKIPGLTPRQLEAIIRLSSAHARIRASNIVDKEDVEYATKLFEAFLKSVATDQYTGQPDADLLTTGMAQSQRDRMWALIELINDIQGVEGASIDDIKKIAPERNIPVETVEKDVDRLVKDVRIYETKISGRYKVINKVKL